MCHLEISGGAASKAKQGETECVSSLIQRRFHLQGQLKKKTLLITANPYGSVCKRDEGYLLKHAHTWKESRKRSIFHSWPQSSTNGTGTSSSALRYLDGAESAYRGVVSLQGWGFKLATVAEHAEGPAPKLFNKRPFGLENTSCWSW